MTLVEGIADFFHLSIEEARTVASQLTTESALRWLTDHGYKIDTVEERKSENIIPLASLLEEARQAERRAYSVWKQAEERRIRLERDCNASSPRQG